MAPAHRVFEGSDLAQVATARHWLIDHIGQGHPAEDTVALLGTELITNAIRHTASGRKGGQVQVAIDIGDNGIWIGVVDQGSATEPSLRQSDGTATSGRGLMLLDVVADSWGHEPLPEGRLVWCLVSSHNPAS